MGTVCISSSKMENDVSLLQEEFDCIILGTGLIECTLSGALSKKGLKVLVLDKNDYYGAGCASLSLPLLYKTMTEETPSNEELVERFGGPVGAQSLDMRRWLNQWNIDLIPKFIMGSGLLARILVHTGVTKYLEFQKAAGSYVYKEGKIHKVPSSASEAFSSNLMGIFEKRRCGKLLQYVENYKQDNPKTHNGINCAKLPFRAVYDKFGVDDNTRSFVGHAVALFTDDKYMDDRPAIKVMEQIMLYRNSFFNLGGGSPYLYPRHGLSELPQGFARQGAVYGATTMLRAPFQEVIYDGEIAKGVRLSLGEGGHHDVQCKYLIGDPSYFQQKVKAVGKVLRMTCISNHAIPLTDNAHSAQVIIPQRESGRSHDIYILCLSSAHCVVPEGKYLVIISTEMNEKEAQLKPEQVFAPALKVIGPTMHRFSQVSDIFEPITNGTEDNCYISRSYDGTSHFQSAAENILEIYKLVTGEELDLTQVEQPEESD